MHTCSFIIFNSITLGGHTQGKGAEAHKTQQTEKASKTLSKLTETGPSVNMASQIHITVAVGDKDKQKQETEGSHSSLGTGTAAEGQDTEPPGAAQPTGKAEFFCAALPAVLCWISLQWAAHPLAKCILKLS